MTPVPRAWAGSLRPALSACGRARISSEVFELRTTARAWTALMNVLSSLNHEGWKRAGVSGCPTYLHPISFFFFRVRGQTYHNLLGSSLLRAPLFFFFLFWVDVRPTYTPFLFFFESEVRHIIIFLGPLCFVHLSFFSFCLPFLIHVMVSLTLMNVLSLVKPEGLRSPIFLTNHPFFFPQRHSSQYFCGLILSSFLLFFTFFFYMCVIHKCPYCCFLLADVLIVCLFVCLFVQLHATIMNTRYRKTQNQEQERDDRAAQRRHRQSFDASAILSRYSNIDLGQHRVEGVHLSERGKFGKDGYYHKVAAISFPWIPSFCHLTPLPIIIIINTLKCTSIFFSLRLFLLLKKLNKCQQIGTFLASSEKVTKSLEILWQIDPLIQRLLEKFQQKPDSENEGRSIGKYLGTGSGSGRLKRQAPAVFEVSNFLLYIPGLLCHSSISKDHQERKKIYAYTKKCWSFPQKEPMTWSLIRLVLLTAFNFWIHLWRDREAFFPQIQSKKMSQGSMPEMKGFLFLLRSIPVSDIFFEFAFSSTVLFIIY